MTLTNPINVPPELPEILKNYAKYIIKTNPQDIISKSAEYFINLQKVQQNGNESEGDMGWNAEGEDDVQMNEGVEGLDESMPLELATQPETLLDGQVDVKESSDEQVMVVESLIVDDQAAGEYIIADQAQTEHVQEFDENTQEKSIIAQHFDADKSLVVEDHAEVEQVAENLIVDEPITDIKQLVPDENNEDRSMSIEEDLTKSDESSVADNQQTAQVVETMINSSPIKDSTPAEANTSQMEATNIQSVDDHEIDAEQIEAELLQQVEMMQQEPLLFDA